MQAVCIGSRPPGGKQTGEHMSSIRPQSPREYTLYGVAALAVTTAGGVLTAWLMRPSPPPEVSKEDLLAVRVLVGELRDVIDADRFAANKREWFVDQAFCALGVRPPTGCAQLSLHPSPMGSSTAPKIQPRLE